MPPPSTPADAKKIRNPRDMHAHGIDEIVNYATTIGALWIIGIATDWDGFSEETM